MSLKYTYPNLVTEWDLLTEDYTSSDDLLADALAQQPEPPCSLCKNFDLCSTQLLACKAFFGYIGQPSDKTTYRDWETMDRLPTSKIYLKCFKNED